MSGRPFAPGFDPRRIRYAPAEERFWGNVRVPDENGCTLWLGSAWNGYGVFSVDRGHVKAHRWSYETFVGPIPDGMVVCHRCDTPRCVNPLHLFIGTIRDNAIDAITKGRMRTRGSTAQGLKAWETKRARQAQGENIGTRLTPAIVLDIRARTNRGEKCASISRALGLPYMTVNNVVNKKRWTHVMESVEAGA